MTTFDTNRASFGPTTVAARISGIVHATIQAGVSWNDARMTRNSLSSLSNRELEDIGLTRADIDMVARTR
ncbi:MAG: hypothetical protein ACI84R_003654 [Candidatus Azotimanducaceae bacterium]|jgi:uncharacterized protein YjiS (DUF1127 family)